jgi:KipI family sensor histidine kinase inhibitor
LPLPEPIRTFGEAALLVEAGTPERAQALAVALRANPPHGFSVAIPGLESVLVEVDAAGTTHLEPVAAHVAQLLATLADRPTSRLRERMIPVVYGGDQLGPDLEAVAAHTGLTPQGVIERHVASELRVLFLGFAPGFAYLGDLPDDLHVPRLATPRTRTPRGSVAIAGRMSGVYPADLPGGWHVIGRTPRTLFDPDLEPPAYLAPGDRVRFEAISEADWDRLIGVAEDW